MKRTFIISAEAKDIMINNINKLNRKIDKWEGFDHITFEILNEKIKKVEDEKYIGGYINRKFYTVEIHGEIPYFDGWEFVSSLEYDRMNECVFVHSLNEEIELPSKYKNKTKIDCDHCKHNRFRVKSFVIYNEKEGYKEVGSTCLKKFFKQDVHKLIPFIDSIENFEEKLNYGGNFVSYQDTLELMVMVKYAIDKFGWVTTREAAYNDKIISTKDKALSLIGSDDMLKVKNSQIKYAKKVIDFYAKQNDDSPKSEFMINLCKAASLEFNKNNKLGILASAFVCYEKVKSNEKIKKVSKNSNFIGELKERIRNIKATVIFRKDLQNDFGESTLYKFKDNLGNIFSSFYSGTKINLGIDDEIILTGTVKSHDEFNNVKSTMLNRISVEEI